jgi:hypothetical protein
LHRSKEIYENKLGGTLCVAANIAKLPELLRSPNKNPGVHSPEFSQIGYAADRGEYRQAAGVGAKAA